MKSLETALRFGAPLIVMDVDKVDPILNNVLNRETHKSFLAALVRNLKQINWGEGRGGGGHRPAALAKKRLVGLRRLRADAP